MPHVTPGNRLYLYQLFVREVGVGKQTMLARIDEVLDADDIMPCDMGFEDVRSLLEELSDFVRLTVFRKGRAYATIIAQPEWDELLAQLDKPREETKDKGVGKGGNRGGAKSWKRKKSRKSPKPAKPRPHGRPAAEVEQVAPEEAAPQAESATSAATESEAKPSAGLNTDQPAVASEQTNETKENPDAKEPGPEPAVASEQDQAPKEEAAEPNAEPASEPVDSPATEPADDSASEPAGELEPAQPARQFIHLSVVSEPEPEPEDDFDFEPKPDSVPSLVPPPDETTPTEPPLPHRIATDVNCGNEQLSVLYQLLPFDVDPIALLDEDWRHARSIEEYEVDGATITFSLRYLHRPNGARVPVSMRRGAVTATGKRWTLVSVGDENLDLAEIGFDGLPLAEHEAWRELATNRTGEANAISPVRELALYAHLGPWDDLLSTLADLAAPEPWGIRHEALREYLGLTFHRIRMEDKIAKWDDGRLAFDTGLITSDFSPIHMVFENRGADGRAFQAFVTTCDGPTPQPATYVRDLGDMTLVEPVSLRFARSLENAYPSSLQEAAKASVARVQRDYRLCVPAYDPVANVMRLLLPLALDTESSCGIDHALVLARTDDGYLATAVLPLERAATCARVVSSELPHWLQRP